ncbi:MAG: aa3-type cytochrome c oxidase subunit IV [Kiloniellales bacterium]|nr:aa3-type cytochrome c oxidase subunit IV [Kiloniellales bacterium]
MAEHDKMLREHQKTWNGFVKLMAVSTAVVAVILILMGIFLV